MSPTETALTDDKYSPLNRALKLLGFDDRTKAAANAALSDFEENGQLEAHLGQMIRHNAVDAAQAVLDDNTITSHVKRIRRKFVALDPDFDAVETVYGMGYRWLVN